MQSPALEIAPTPGRILRELRIVAGLTQGQLGFKADVTNGTVSHAELDKRVPSELTQERIARALGVHRREIWPDRLDAAS